MKKISFIKNISIIIAFLTFIVSSLDTFAAEKEIVNIIDEVAVIKDTDVLIQRAKIGIDEFKQDTGLDFNVSCEANNLSLISSESRLSAFEMDGLITTYQTSQYLGDVVNERGEIEKLYALQGIVVYSNTTASDTKTNGGCTITTTLYIQWGSGNRIELKLLRSSANISGTLRPSSLKMENCVYEGWTTNVNHYKTQTISLPSNGIHNLYPSYSGYISEYSSYVGAEDTVSFGQGGTLKTSVYYSP